MIRTVKQSLTVAERKAVAETLREWARCFAGGRKEPPPTPPPGSPAYEAAVAWCWNTSERQPWPLQGATAALGLCFAAAMVEAGDSC